MRKECVQFSYHFHVPLWYFSMNNNNRKNIKAAYLLWLIVTVSSQPHTGKKWWLHPSWVFLDSSFELFICPKKKKEKVRGQNAIKETLIFDGLGSYDYIFSYNYSIVHNIKSPPLWCHIYTDFHESLLIAYCLQSLYFCSNPGLLNISK